MNPIVYLLAGWVLLNVTVVLTIATAAVIAVAPRRRK